MLLVTTKCHRDCSELICFIHPYSKLLNFDFVAHTSNIIIKLVLLPFQTQSPTTKFPGLIFLEAQERQ